MTFSILLVTGKFKLYSREPEIRGALLYIVGRTELDTLLTAARHKNPKKIV